MLNFSVNLKLISFNFHLVQLEIMKKKNQQKNNNLWEKLRFNRYDFELILKFQWIRDYSKLYTLNPLKTA